MTTTDVLVFTFGLVAVITGLTQAAKMVGLSPLYAPLFEILLGVAFTDAGVLSGALTIGGVAAGGATFFYATIYGVIAGLTAAGLYNNAKAAVDASNSKPDVVTVETSKSPDTVTVKTSKSTPDA